MSSVQKIDSDPDPQLSHLEVFSDKQSLVMTVELLKNVRSNSFVFLSN